MKSKIITIVFRCPICNKTYTLDVNLDEILEDIKTRGVSEVYTFHPEGPTPHIISFHIDQYGFPRGQYLMKINIDGIYRRSLPKSPRKIIDEFFSKITRTLGEYGYIRSEDHVASKENILNIIDKSVVTEKDYRNIIKDVFDKFTKKNIVNTKEDGATITLREDIDEQLTKDLAVLILAKITEDDPNSAYIISREEENLIIKRVEYQ
ncbi:MAG: hypothetical protein Q6363_000035 [Candidatus Njordarchaeota archaeon]